MEDDEGTSLEVNEYSIHEDEVEHSAMDDKLPGAEKLPNTEQCDFVPELDDSTLVGAEATIVSKEDETEAVEEEIMMVGDKIVTETEINTMAAISAGAISVAESHDSELVGAEPLIAAKDEGDNEAVVGETEMEIGSEAEAEAEEKTGKGGGEELDTELHDSQIVGAESLIAAKEEEDNEVAVGEETPTADAQMETETETEAELAKGGENDEDEAVVAEEEGLTVDTEMETETDVVESANDGRGKRRRGRNSKVPARATAQKVIEEDVCFICFDGGELVLCDRRGCPKAYHPSCVNRDEAFFRTKGRWNCGWHLCSTCQKSAYYMCYTCTFSLCKGCVKDAVILCVRGNKGFCETCMKMVMLVENNEQGNKEQVDFDDKSSWEYLFKDYWIELKAKQSLSSVELSLAKNPWKGSDVLAGKQESPDEQFDVNYDGGSGSDSSSEKIETSRSKRRKSKKRSKSLTKEEHITSEVVAVGAEGIPTPRNTEWASQELLEFVMHMKNGDGSVLSQFDVQALLLEYIKRNKLRDPRRKSQIICDARLENLFGKARVGHFEMLKLLESHFLIKEASQIDDIQGSVVDTEDNQLDADGNNEALTKSGKDRKRKTRKKGDWRGPQSNLDDYAAIDIHNINLIYLRRKLMEDLLEDSEKFSDKVVGTFVRIRISGSNQKQDIYRLVQVVGTSQAAEPYKVGKRTTDIMLEILNLNKTEVISIDTISNQEFTEDECKRLRQSIKCGLINRLNVGEILDKTIEIQGARVNDWLETEIVRLSHLRDRASEKGRRKELRECVEKLQLLKTPEERRRRLEEIPEIHADPNMDPSYESEDADSEMDNKREVFTRPRGSGFSRRGREPISPGRDFSPKDSWGGARRSSGNSWELNRNLSNKNFSNKAEDSKSFEIPTDNAWNQGRNNDTKQSNNFEKLVRSESFSAGGPETSPASLSALVAETDAKISETEKVWHYQDPSGKVQGPFSMVQLRKWSSTGFFPVDLKIWRTTGKQDDSVPLTDALAGKFRKELPSVDNGTSLQQGREGQDGERLNFDHNRGAQNSHGNLVHPSQSYVDNWNSQSDLSSLRVWNAPSVEIPILSADSVDYGSRNNSVNLPSPTPTPRNNSVNLPSPTPNQSTPSSIGPSGNNEFNAMGSIEFSAPTPVLNSGGQSTRVSENDPSTSHSGFSRAPNSEQSILAASTDSLQTFQSIVAGESHSHQVLAPASAAGMDQSVNSQHTPFGAAHGWGTASSQNLETNSSVHVAGQAPAYGHWGGVPPTGNFSTQGVVSALPPPDPWRTPIPGNQSNMPPNVPWGWGGPVPENTNMNWGATVQGNPNPGWVAPPGGIAQVFAPANQAWVASTGNANPGWVAPGGNPGTNIQGPPAGNANPGWVAASGNPGANVQGPPPGNANPGWGSPGGSQSMRGSERHHNGERFSGQRDGGSRGGGRPWNRQSSFGSGGSSRPPPRGQRVCQFYESGHCKKGSSCDFLHT